MRAHSYITGFGGRVVHDHICTLWDMKKKLKWDMKKKLKWGSTTCGNWVRS